MNYYEIDFQVNPKNPWSDILSSELADLGYESFVETENGMKAYGPVNSINLEHLIQLPGLIKGMNSEVEINYAINEIQEKNWNAAWEADFEPVFVNNRLAILAPFHSKELEKELTIWIQPQMSFGTGHHQTTWMMAKMLLEMSSMPVSILDMGSGTGVLAILVEKLDGKEILAIDVEDWAYENCIENAKRNHCKEITALLGDVDLIDGKSFELILANINKNVLKEQLPSYSKTLKKNGTLLLSGFFESDVDELVAFASNHGFSYNKHITRDNWACIKLIKN